MYYKIPSNVSRKLDLLQVNGADSAKTRAAMALWRWFNLTGPGQFIRAPRKNYRSEVRLNPRWNYPSFEWCYHDDRRPDLRLVIFTDDSALVLMDRKTRSDRLDALPVVFKVTRDHEDPLRSLRVNSQGRSRVDASIALVHPNTYRPKWDMRIKFTAAEVDADEALRTHPVFDALRHDLEVLRPLFDKPTWILPPKSGPLPSGKIDQDHVLHFSLPKKAVGGHCHWVEGLPYDLLKAGDRHRIACSYEDLISYLAHHYRDRFTDFSCQSWLGDIGRTETSCRISFLDNRNRAREPSLALLLKNPERGEMPIPEDRRFAMDFNDKASVHKVAETPICYVRPRVLSNHELLELSVRFGPVNPDYF